MRPDFFKGLEKWQQITEQSEVILYVVYVGDENMQMDSGQLFRWTDIAQMLAQIYDLHG